MKLLRILLFLYVGFETLYAESMIDWIDIPQADYKIILASQEVEIENLNQLIDHYHSIDKFSLEKRISVLDMIRDHLSDLSKQEKFTHQKSTILFLKRALQRKREYLKQLLEMPSDETIMHYHLDIGHISDLCFQPIFLRNNNSYSLKMKEFWGNFWLESIDPCHRRLANYYQFWLNTKPISKTYQSFFLWLESQPIPKNVPIVEYYSDTQLQACHITSVDGYLKKSGTNELVNTDPSKRNIFIINLSKELYLETWREGIWHTTLSRGKPVLGTGLLQIKQGVITTIAFESGHYMPSLEQGFQSLQIFREQGVHFAEPFEVIFFENRNKYKISLFANDIEQYQKFNETICDISKRELISSNEF